MKKYGLFYLLSWICFWGFLLIGWTYTLDTDTPVGTDPPSVLDDHDRLTKDAFQERLNIEHVFDLTGSQVSHADSGKHTDITCTSVTSTGAISGTTITGSGAISGTTISGSNDLTINTDKFVVTAATGNTTVAGTFTSTGVATLADASVLATSAAPVNDVDISNKKYVDDQITANAAAANSLCKGWACVNSAGTLLAGYNATSIKNSTGNYTITWTTPFSSANYSVVFGVGNTTQRTTLQIVSQVAGSITVQTGQQGHGAYDAPFNCAAFGAQ